MNNDTVPMKNDTFEWTLISKLFFSTLLFVGYWNAMLLKGRVFEMEKEIKHRLEMKGKREFMAHFNDETWIQSVPFLCDVS